MVVAVTEVAAGSEAVVVMVDSVAAEAAMAQGQICVILIGHGRDSPRSKKTFMMKMKK